MGNNVYETPRNSSKWHTGNEKGKRKQQPYGSQTEDTKERLKKLAQRAKQNQMKSQ